MHRSCGRLLASAAIVIALVAGGCSGGGPVGSLADLAAAIAARTAATAVEGATSTTTTTAPSTTSSTPAAGAFTPKPIRWQRCGGRLECGSLQVPLDYANPTGPTITLSLDRLPARRPDERIGALVVNPGGPGASGTSFASGIPLPGEVLDRFDIVGFDPRGVGDSTPVGCGSDTVPAFRDLDSTPDTPAEQAQLDEAAKAIADDCGANAGDLLPHLGTDDVARDMDTIRAALGETQISYYGASYGTLIGLRFLALFPRSARAVVLDGVVDPTQTFTEFLRQQTVAFETSINRVFDACGSGPRCPPGGARAAYDEVAARVEVAQIPTSTGNPLGPGELPVAALLPSYDPSTAPLLYRGLTEALEGDGTTLERLFDDYDSSADYPLYAAVECTDSPHPVGADAYHTFAQELIALSPRFGGAIANELLPCAFWPAPVHDITGPVVAPDGPPVLVVGNTGDAATPYQQAVDVAGTLAHGRLLTFDASGHTALGRSACVASAETAYFVDLTLPAEGTVCAR